jgi:enoyl-CoA hydratase
VAPIRHLATLRCLPRLTSSANRVLDASIAYDAVSNRTEDHKEAVSAFLEKRRPVFQGR